MGYCNVATLHRYGVAVSTLPVAPFERAPLPRPGTFSPTHARAQRAGPFLPNTPGRLGRGCTGELQRLAQVEGPAHDVDCVVLGARGLNNAKALILASVSLTVLNRAPCACLTMK